MALNRSTAHVAADPPAAAMPAAEAAGNDAFSFWKLPEDWREELEHSNGASREMVEHYLFERYLPQRARRPAAGLQLYYAFKEFLPLGIRHRINSIVVRSRRPNFPKWPFETAVLDVMRDWLHRSLATVGETDGWHIGFWPGGAATCVVLTHDVESTRGIELMEPMADLEERYGFRSAWNIPLAQYQVDWKRVEKLRERGFELGAHGLSHDGKLFRSERDFQSLVPLLEGSARHRNLRGFRSPSTLRCLEWIGALDFDFDSTYSDTDPYEPQPGGSCSVFPFYLGRLVELPYTLPQDHTLIHLLRRDPLPIWIAKARWVASVGGMILTLTHPDYSGEQPYLSAYEELLKWLSGLDSAWRALPCEVAAWWQRRRALKLVLRDGKPVIAGSDTAGAVPVRLSTVALARRLETVCG